MRRRLRVVPGRAPAAILGVCAVAILLALVLGMPVTVAARVSVVVVVALVVATLVDFLRSTRAWRAASPQLARGLPAAFALGVRKQIQLELQLEGDETWVCEVHDAADVTLAAEGLPLSLAVTGGGRVTATYAVVPTRRGTMTFAAADVRVRSRWGLCELLEQVGERETRRVYPDFAQVARYAWLAGDRRLQEIGIKTYQQRGQGTDFKQLAEYRIGDSVRHIDWRATLRVRRPIVREFQDERDQCVLLLVDCGRRMRADDRRQEIGTSHFDQVLNAVMLVSYVALKQGDQLGALTFGTPPGQQRYFDGTAWTDVKFRKSSGHRHCDGVRRGTQAAETKTWRAAQGRCPGSDPGGPARGPVVRHGELRCSVVFDPVGGDGADDESGRPHHRRQTRLPLQPTPAR